LAHILLGWELGGNRGHAVRLAQIADILKSRGHQVSFAMQRIDALSVAETGGSPVWPAPVAPRLLVSTARPQSDNPNTMGDILARLGCLEPEMVAAMLRTWRQLLSAIRPDAIVAEFAPWLLLAARGRVPAAAGGTGFDTPPSDMARFPSLTGRPAVFDEAEILDSVNRALRSVGSDPLAALPAMFAAERELAGTYRELDGYAEWRTRPLVRPGLPLPPPEIAPAGGEEIFVYAPELLKPEAPLWQGLAASKLPVRVHIPKVGESYRQGLREMGFAVEPEPLLFSTIAQRSRLLVSHGGHGFVCSGLLAGLPQVVCPYDLEKTVYARAVTKLGLGGFVPMTRIKPAAFAESLINLYRDDALAARAREAAPGFQARYSAPMQQEMADAVEALL
jgi:UDP:flavonoid glycosyltransferase YjiC (YdhE family)